MAITSNRTDKDLENVLLDNPNFEGAFCLSTSYRSEPDPSQEDVS